MDEHDIYILWIYRNILSELIKIIFYFYFSRVIFIAENYVHCKKRQCFYYFVSQPQRMYVIKIFAHKIYYIFLFCLFVYNICIAYNYIRFLHSQEDKQKSILFKKNGDNEWWVCNFYQKKKDMIRKPEINNIGKWNVIALNIGYPTK